MASRAKILIKLIKSTERENPPANFTAIVMREIEAEARFELAVDPALQSILKTSGPQKLHANFTGKVMANLQGTLPSKSEKSLISLNGWMTIATAFTTLILWLVFRRPALATQGLTSYLLNVGSSITDIISDLDDGSIYLATLVAAGGLVVIDYLLKVKHEPSQ